MGHVSNVDRMVAFYETYCTYSILMFINITPMFHAKYVKVRHDGINRPGIIRRSVTDS